MTQQTDILIIGGGVAGLSTAYFLAKKGQKSVVVLEQEKLLGGHASGRNAGMLRQSLSDPVLAQLAIQSRRAFGRAEKNGWRGLSLEPNGSLLVAKNGDKEALKNIEKTLQLFSQKGHWFSKKQCVKKVPLLSEGDFDCAFFCPKDAMVNVEALLSGFEANLKMLGIPVRRGKRLESVQATDGGFRVRSGAEEWFAKKLVNAAGAWAGWVAEQSGASSVPLMAYRRHLFFCPPSAVLRLPSKKNWPFVWDVTHDFYFRPYGSTLLLSPCDKTPESEGDRREKVFPAMKRVLQDKLKKFSGPMAGLCVTKAKSGLRTMAPDGRFVIGKDPVKKNFYWVAGLGGHGVTTCFSVGELAANGILGRNVDRGFERALSPKRFVGPKIRQRVAPAYAGMRD